jgi:hypothetical protein
MNDNNRQRGNSSGFLHTALVTAFAATMLLGGCAQLPFPGLAMDRTNAEEAQNADADTVARADSVLESIPDPIPEPQEKPKPGKLYEWSGDGRPVSRIVIDTNEQKARFYDGKEQIGWTTIASGVSKHPTPRGEFTILEKVANKRSNLYGKIVNSKGAVIKGSATGKDPVPPGGRFVGASMPNFMRMTYDGIGMHAGPIPRPGSPASHGCIRMPKTFAATVFKHVSTGTAVTVVGNGPDYGNYGERVARQQAEERARRAAAEAAAEGSALDALDAEVDVMRNAQANADTSGSPVEAEGRTHSSSGRSSGGTRRTSSANPSTAAGTASSSGAVAASASSQPTQTVAGGSTSSPRPTDPQLNNGSRGAVADPPALPTDMGSVSDAEATASPTRAEATGPGSAGTEVQPPASAPSSQAPATPAETTPVQAETVQQPQTSAQAPAAVPAPEPITQPTVTSDADSQSETPQIPAPSATPPPAPSYTPPTPPVRSASEPEQTPEPV